MHSATPSVSMQMSGLRGKAFGRHTLGRQTTRINTHRAQGLTRPDWRSSLEPTLELKRIVGVPLPV